MISFRYHIVSIVSVFLSLAIGVALGGGPLKGEVDNSLVNQVKSDRRAKAALQDDIAALRASNRFGDDFATAAAERLVGGRLDERLVTVVVLPGATEATVTAVDELISVGGGSVSATIRVGEKLLDVSNKQLVDELGSQLLDGTPDVTVSEEATGYERMGTLLARAVATDTDTGAAVDDTSNSILSGLSTAGLLSPAEELTRRGSLVLFVGGAANGEDQQASGTIVASLAKAVDASSDGVVVAGPTGAADQGGVVDVTRRDVVTAREVSSVDALEQVPAQVATVAALAEQAQGSSGHYGAVDAADGALPGDPAAG